MPEHQSKADLISERQSNLPLPEDPPVASDWNSADATKVNVGSGRDVTSQTSTGNAQQSGLEGAATGGSGVREAGGVDMSNIGREGVEKKN
ncbi:gamma-tubulin [Ciborinia camelliae]|nr:gamma-tubulin [Ciborinia camelliae]